MTSGIERDDLRLESLYLPTQFQHRASSKLPEAEGNALTDLEEACHQKGVDVVYEKLDEEWINTSISQEFRRRQRDRRRLEAALAT